MTRVMRRSTRFCSSITVTSKNCSPGVFPRLSIVQLCSSRRRYTSSFDSAPSSSTAVPTVPTGKPPPRHTSSVASTSTSTSTTKSTADPDKPIARVNGPITTLPAPLVVPDRKPDQSLFPSYAFTLGKAYLNFYKTGVKAIWTNFKAARTIQRQLDERFHGSLRAAVDAHYLDRYKLLLLTRSWHDVKRVPVFALIFAICGEFTPLVVIAATGLVPATCRIPKQVEGERKKLEARRRISFRNLTTSLAMERPNVRDLNRMQLLHISWSLGLASSIWDYLGGQLPGLPTAILRRRVERRVEFLDVDDTLIERAGGVKDMTSSEVQIACTDRGIDIIGRNDTQCRSALGSWLTARRHATIERLLLTRSSVWPKQSRSDM